MITKALIIISSLGALSDILSWLGITPLHLSNNKIISVIVNFLNFKVPLYLVSLIVLIVILFYKYIVANKELKKPLAVEKRVVEIKQNKVEENKENKIAATLSQEQKYLLLRLLEQSSKTRYRYLVEDDYKNTFGKTVADFNIVEAQLKDLELIYVQPGMSGNCWQLSKKGLKVVTIIHDQKK